MNFDLLAQHITPATVLDIGANTGAFHNEARLRWPSAVFTLVEGNIECEAQLRATGAEVIMALLSDTEKEVEFFTRRDAPACTGASIYREDTDFYAGDKAVPQLRRTNMLDVLFGESLFSVKRTFDLVKLDTQGSELDIILGGLDLISDAKAIVIELSRTEYNTGAPMGYEVDSFLRHLGFSQVAKLGEICHPLDPSLIVQDDVLYMKDSQ